MQCTHTDRDVAFDIQWIDCYIEDLEIEKGSKPIRYKSVPHSGLRATNPQH